MALFRRLFRGRDDMYALRWQSNSGGRSGYAPACANEWRPGICEKPRVSCRDCNHRELLPLSDAAICQATVMSSKSVMSVEMKSPLVGDAY